jgi:hypothetical protein
MGITCTDVISAETEHCPLRVALNNTALDNTPAITEAVAPTLADNLIEVVRVADVVLLADTTQENAAPDVCAPNIAPLPLRCGLKMTEVMTTPQDR